jgi:hypothetical protein
MTTTALNPFEPETDRCWPLGPNYLQLFPDGTNNYVSWSRFRLIAASWYRDTLVNICDQTHDLDRFVGVEMALDGFLSNASSAIDAATGGLIDAIETHRGTANADRTPDHVKSWQRAKALAAQVPVIDLKCAKSFDTAMEGANTDAPTGWLAQLRRTRNQMTHHSTLVRHFLRTVSEPETSSGFVEPTQMTVGGRGQVEPIGYINGALAQLQELVDLVLDDAGRLSV